MKILGTASAVALATCLLSACGSSSGGSASAESASPTPTQSPTPTLAPVSDATACSLLFPGTKGDPGPLQSMADLVNSGDAEPKLLDKAADDLDTVERLSLQAPDDLKGQLTTYLGAVKPYLKDLQETGSANLETTNYKAAGLEIINICTPLL